MNRPRAMACSAALTLFSAVAFAASVAQADEGAVVNDEAALRALYPEVDASSDLAGESIVDGVVLDRAGEPVEGTVVVLEAWPTGEAARYIAVGETIPVSVVAKALTDEDGRFELKSAATTEVAQYADGDTVSFQLVAQAAEGPEVFAFSGDVDTDGGTVTMADSTLEEAVELTIEEAAGIEDLIAAEETQKSKSCNYKKIEDIRTSAKFARVYSTSADVTVKYTLVSGASTTLGVAVNVGSSSSSFKASGSSTVKVSTGGYSSKKGKGVYDFHTNAYYYKARQQCLTYDYRLEYTDSYRVVPSEVTGAFSSAVSAATPSTVDTRCALGDGGYYVDKGKSTAWAAGVSLKSKIGVDLSAQAGWSKSVELHVSTPIGKPRFEVCGTKALPTASDPGHIVVKPTTK